MDDTIFIQLHEITLADILDGQVVFLDTLIGIETNSVHHIGMYLFIHHICKNLHCFYTKINKH